MDSAPLTSFAPERRRRRDHRHPRDLPPDDVASCAPALACAPGGAFIAPMVQVRVLQADELASRLDELAAVLVDAVASGASVSFLASMTPADARAFFADVKGAARA